MNKTIATAKPIKTLNEPHASLFLILLFSGDFTFLGLHLINVLTPLISNPMLTIDFDRGYPEMYQYMKFFWITLLLLYVSLENKSFNYAAIAVVFGYFLCDDALQIHERLGRHIAAHLNFVPILGLRNADFGELAASAIAGILLLPLLIWAYRSGSRVYRKAFQDIIFLVFILGFFGIVVDMMHISARSNGEVRLVLGMIEDGGEMLSVSFIAW